MTVQSKQIKGLRYICQKETCWDKYHKEAAARDLHREMP